MKNKLRGMLSRIECARAAVAIRSGLVMLIPVLLIGSAMLIVKNLPLPFYQSFITGFADGFIIKVADFIYNATFGMLSVFVTLFISYCYSLGVSGTRSALFPLGMVSASLIVFAILVGVMGSDSAWREAIGVKGMFTAIVSATLAPAIYARVADIVSFRAKPYSDGADAEFIRAIAVFLPALLTVFLFAFTNALVSTLSNTSSIHALFINIVCSIFFPLGRTLLSGMLMVLASSVMWFFGIHGSDVLESVMSNIFTPATQINAALSAVGAAPTEILTKGFFDVFVLIGGCGTALSLLLAILLFSRRAGDRRLGKMAALPMLFNINEVMIFGFPVIYNPMLFIPFILTPLVSYFVSYAAMASGLVPLITHSVDWTTPVLIGGYQATGSLAGSALQLVNVALGVMIYRPFVLAYGRQQEALAKRRLEELVEIVKQNESTLSEVALTGLATAQGEVARNLSADLERAIDTDSMTMYYQPQYDANGNMAGAEALLRWFHPLYGTIYPPLIIELAREAGMLSTLEQRILSRSVQDAKALREITGADLPISINISADTLGSPDYMARLRAIAADGSVDPGNICLEITEQMALLSGKEIEAIFGELRGMGYRLAIDDFSMGHTSLSYLQEHRFDLVKLDGSIVRGIRDNPRCKDIIASIVHLSKSLGFEVLAEYVETEEIRRSLEEIGCLLYQGYLFSPAVPKDELIKKLTEYKSQIRK